MSFPPFDAAEDPEWGTCVPKLHTPVPGPESRTWVDVLAAHECPGITARRARRATETGVDQDPPVWVRSRGANVWDADGNTLVDLTAGFGAATVGHGHPSVRAAVHKQVEEHIHGLGDAFPARVRIELARRLAGLLPPGLEQVIFGSGGAEAVEAAIKTAVLKTGRHRVLAFEGGYHGLSLGVVQASHYKVDFRAPFAGLASAWVSFAPFGAPMAALRRAFEDGGLPAAVIVEPVQGRGGMRPAPVGWLAALRTLCDEFDVVLIFDEIFSGACRTGPFVAALGEGVRPDLICVGKGLAGGLPLSACVGTRDVMAAWGSSRGEAIHTSTFLGHPLGCASALAVLDLVADGSLPLRVNELSAFVERTLGTLVAEHPRWFTGLRGRGLMRGLLLTEPGRSMTLCRALLRRGFLVLPCGLSGEAIGFSPPAMMTRAQWEAVCEALRASVAELG